MKKTILLFSLFSSILAGANAQTPVGPVPSKAQLAWHNMEYYMFIHFGVNTFTDKEWGHGDEDPAVFNPSQLDARQWARTAKAAGMKGIIITAKHHDGFCLWPSAYSTHTVRESKWKNGKGDVLAELSAACKEYGLKFGVYLSPWDRNHPDYGTDKYNQTFVNQLTEVHTKYGDVFEQWFDGANGEGPNGKKQVYDWPLFNGTVYKHHPDAIIFSDAGPGCRWIGNERGFAGETNWSTLNRSEFAPGSGGIEKVLNEGQENGTDWVPGEADVSIRPGWFYSPATDDKVKSLNELLDIYYGSVGRNANLLLNIPVDRRGLIHKNDSLRLMELRKELDATFKRNLAKGTGVLTDGNTNTFWTAPTAQDAAFELTFPKAVTFNRFQVQEAIAYGQRVRAFKVEAWQNGAYKEIASQTTIGYKRILRLPLTTATKLRITILDAKAPALISEVALFRAPEVLASPVFSRNKQGDVIITAASADPALHYTLNGSEPTIKSPRYTGPIPFAAGGTVKAKAFVDNGKRSAATVTAEYDIAPTKWRVTYADTAAPRRQPELAIDGDPKTAWSTPGGDNGYPHEIKVDLGEVLHLKGFTYLPVGGEQPNGVIAEYMFETSLDGKTWGDYLLKGAFDNILNSPVQQRVLFDRTVKARYIRFVALRGANPRQHWASVAELGIITK
ncbi:alpha-L-fucosidase [Chitinophaga horti]|uniref:alpha-L-fucosidase n=1 Tax=Chitinophaga horti TaxID=2920382 RepID=A0ABY6IW47_9BACT|nr:alpha-L-fucosidase [Chitinophaga horti]UYQ91602.1 alpha-L-fucosidase [Chitinophaga horti]